MYELRMRRISRCRIPRSQLEKFLRALGSRVWLFDSSDSTPLIQTESGRGYVCHGLGEHGNPLIAQSGCRMSNLLMGQGVEVFFFFFFDFDFGEDRPASGKLRKNFLGLCAWKD